jgi:hypothetical protein
MVPQYSYTEQPHESEEIIEDYVSSEIPQDYDDTTNEQQENARLSVVSSLISGAKSVAFDVSSYWAKVLIRYLQM